MSCRGLQQVDILVNRFPLCLRRFHVSEVSYLPYRTFEIFAYVLVQYELHVPLRPADVEYYGKCRSAGHLPDLFFHQLVIISQ